MTEVSNVKVYDLEECIRASGYPMVIDAKDNKENYEDAVKRCIRLCKTPSNSGHANFLTGIRVSFNLKYPQYLTPQLQRYNFIDIVSSQSKMHRLAKMDIWECCNDYTHSSIIEVVKDIQEQYNDCFNEYLKSPKDEILKQRVYETYMELISSLPMGFELTMRVSTNYMQLKNIYHQRKHHKLKEDWGAITEMIKKLPYFVEFIANN